MSKPTGGVGQDSMWWRNEGFKSQNRPDYHNLSGKKHEKPSVKNDADQKEGDKDQDKEKEQSHEDEQREPETENRADAISD